MNNDVNEWLELEPEKKFVEWAIPEWANGAGQAWWMKMEKKIKQFAAIWLLICLIPFSDWRHSINELINEAKST